MSNILKIVLVAGICALASAAWASVPRFGSAEANFSSSQGENGWCYRLWNPDVGNVHDLIMWDKSGLRWLEGDGVIWAGGAHPHSTDWYVVREWTCPENCTVIVSGSVGIYKDASGVRVAILTAYDLEQKVWGEDLAANQNTKFSERLTLAKGDQLLFTIIGKTGIKNNAASWSININKIK